MSDNIFDRLAELLSSPGPVNWGLATELGSSVAGDPGRVEEGSTDYWLGLVDTAQRMLGTTTALALTPPPMAAVDRRDWTTQTIPGFDYLAEPLATQLSEGQSSPFGPVFSIMVGLQIGSMVGSISHRALANFDSALPPLDAGRLRFVAPNVAEFTESHDLDPHQAHLWVAAHELVQNRLLALPVVAERFRSLVATYIQGLEPDPEALPLDGIEAGLDPERLGQMMQDPSFLTGMFTGPHQADDLASIQSFLAVVEGYVGYLLNQLDSKLMPQLDRIREAVDRRRATPSQGEVFLQKMLGIELRRPEYRAGTAFFDEVERRWGPDATATVWTGP
ncbi:MAG: zinc-dependent metalloprotease, partial [Actinomycetia bacterium]|nr:zinc-dependent metalloprotease [Actinomycetes bacterium]